jgi:hypothetical protein
MSHRAISNRTCKFLNLTPSSPHLLGFFGCIDPRRGCPSLHGKKGFVIPIFWITKEMMSRGPQVVDMKYQETT